MNPTQSAFILEDGYLHLSQVMAQEMRKYVELAVLSACETAKGNNALPDETMHLAVAMPAVEYWDVAGTMWSVSDEYAPIIINSFCTKLGELRRNKRESKNVIVYALYDAVSSFRASGTVPWVLKWAPFVYLVS
jgi:CHAT domain-containing protein